MKKIININLSGRVIPIEDSAYEKLQGYIDSLRKYFAHEEGREEIINDIESRIAELMSEKIRKGANAVIDADVEEIIASMGRVEDFEKAEDEPLSSPGQTSANYSEAPYKKKRGRLYRNSDDKILGGVASGLANYLDLDPSVVRILMLLFVFTAGIGILLYIILWIALPSKDLENYVGKRLFRNPDNKVIGGVAGGLAAYFNIQAWVLRLILISPLLLNIIFGTFNGIFFAWHRDIFPNILIAPFTGTFILAYIILWMVLPEASSQFEKMEMRGEKVDVNRIRQNVQDGMSDVKSKMQSMGQDVKASAQQLGERGKVFASEVAESTRPAVRGLGHVIAVIFKAFFIFVAGCIALGLFAALIVLIFGGVASWPVNDFLWTSNLQKMMAWGTLLFFLTVPVIAFITWLIRRMVRVRSKRSHMAWIFGGLWVIGWVCAIVFAASIAKDLREYRSTESEINITQPSNGRMIVRVNEPQIHYSRSFWWIDDNDDSGWDITDDSIKYTNIKVRYDSSEDGLYHVRVSRYSAGSNITDAQTRAAQTVFNISSQDSILNLGSALAIGKDSKFRGQGVIIEISIPVGKKIRFDETVMDTYNPWVVRRTWKDGRRYRNRWQSDWDYDEYHNLKSNIDYVMGEDGKLFDPNKPPKTNGDKKEELRKSIRDRERKMQEDQKKLEEDKRRLNDSTNGTVSAARKEKNEMQYALNFPMLSVFN
jgi:phage shock protein PspC (stress-responsive transcriptional regulator)